MRHSQRLSNDSYPKQNHRIHRHECRINKGFLMIPILSRINPTSRTDTYFFKLQTINVL
jgi:hypothetical protein